MSTVLLPNRARQELARSVYRDIVTERDRWYMFAAKTTAWDGGVVHPPIDSWEYLSQVHRDMLFVKKVTPQDIVFLARRVTWEVGKVYAMYDDTDRNLMSKDFYVINSSNCVYKCLYNGGDEPSYIEPASQDPINPFILSDGYMWKFLYKVSANDALRFLSPQYIPVRYYTAGTDFSVNGYLQAAEIQDGGSGYTWAHVHVDGDGAGAVIRAQITGGAISSLTIVENGTGYSFANAVIYGDGDGAEVRLVLTSPELLTGSSDELNQRVASEGVLPGAIHVIVVEESGSGYVPGSTNVTLTGDGNDEAKAVIDTMYNGEVGTIRMANEGLNYTYADVEISGITGSGASARAIISPPGGHGSNLPKELGATTLGIFTEMNNALSQAFFVDNDYNQIGIVKNPKRKMGGSIHGGHRYWRVKFSATQSAATDTLVSLANIEFRSVPTDTDQTGTGTATASSSSTGNVPANLFNANTTDYWESNTDIDTEEPWVAYDFGSRIEIGEVALTSYSESTEYPESFAVQYSDNGTVWITAWVVTAATYVGAGTETAYSDPRYVHGDIDEDLYNDRQYFTANVGTTCYTITVADQPTADMFGLDDEITTDIGGRFTVIQKVGTKIWLSAISAKIFTTSLLANATQENFSNVAINSLTLPSVDKLTGELVFIKSLADPYVRSADQNESYQLFLRF